MKNIVIQLVAVLCLSTLSVAQTDTSKCASFKASIKNIFNQSGGINVEPNGEIDLSIIGGKKPYSCSILNTTPKDPFANWNSGSLGNSGGPVVCNFPIPCDSIIKGLPAGTYSIYIYDGNYCSATLNTKISKTSAIDCSKLWVKINEKINPFSGEKNGKISVTANGGGYPYHYKWDNGKTTNTINDLFQGDYSVTITDTNNCQTSVSVKLDNDTSKLYICKTLNIDLVTKVNPVKKNGLIEVSIIGGTAPYSIFWNYNNQLMMNNGQTKIENLVNGNYEINVIDANNCKNKLSTLLENDTVLCKTFDVNISKIKNQDYKFNVNNGAVEFEFKGGKLPINNNFNFGFHESPNKISNLGPNDNYSITFTDGNQCERKVNFAIEIDSTLCKYFDINLLHLSMENDSIIDKLEFGAIGGTEPYAYRWEANTQEGYSNIISKLQFSNSMHLNVIAFDAVGCVTQIIKSFQFDSIICSKLTVELDTLSSNLLTETTSCNGAIALNIKSEFTGVDILWNTYSRTSKIENLCIGNYSVLVMDSNNCIKTISTTISELIKTSSLSSLTTDNPIKLFPNPCIEKITVEFNTNLGEIEVFDLLGNQLIKLPYSNKSTMTLDTSILRSGTYILRIKTEDHTSNHIFDKY